MMKEACEKRTTNILDISGKKYAFDSTTIPLCEPRKEGMKAHVSYDIEAQIPAFYTVTTASKHDSTAMSSIHYEPNAYYIFDRAYDSFKELYRIHLTDSFFVVRAKTNLNQMKAKNAQEYNDRCGSETGRISLREEISGAIQTRPIL